jgi:hypothetical protein
MRRKLIRLAEWCWFRLAGFKYTYVCDLYREGRTIGYAEGYRAGQEKMRARAVAVSDLTLEDLPIQPWPPPTAPDGEGQK